MNVHKNARLTPRGESGLYGRLRAGRRRRPWRKPQASARGPFGSGLIDIAVKDWPGCRIAHPARRRSGRVQPRPRRGIDMDSVVDPDKKRRVHPRCHTMIDPADELRHRVQSALVAAFCNEARTVTAEVHRSEHADYQSDQALSLARGLRRAPRDVAASVVGRLRRDPVLDAASVSGPGFINLTLRSEYLSDAVVRMLNDDRLGLSPPEHPVTVVVDYSSPNLAKDSEFRSRQCARHLVGGRGAGLQRRRQGRHPVEKSHDRGC
jgi:hypothetical protein